jgi:SAM-dependent methyltransferase
MSDNDFNGIDIVGNYRKNYSIPPEAVVTREMVLQHWNLERGLTKELLETTPANRWEVFERAYSRLYNELDWLNKLVHAGLNTPAAIRYRAWVDAIGDPPKKIYEIGSGKGTMISYLSTLGYDCKATEITRERGGKFLEGNESVKLGNTDGIHLDQFEEPDTYDVVLSDQVIEHFHPKDILQHFKGVHSILKKGGHYIFSTPHMYTGPHDVSKVFQCATAKGMHLKEYKFEELIRVAREAGFTKVTFAYKFSHELEKIKFDKLFRLLGVGKDRQKAIASKAFYNMVNISERAISLVPGLKAKKAVAGLLTRPKLFLGNIFLDVTK